MNRKINTICFIFLFVFLISAVSAANIENETSTNIQQPDPDQDLCKVSVESKEDSFYADKKLCANQNTNSKQTKETVYLTAPNVKMHYKDGTIFKVTLKDKNKKAIPNAKVKISINGATYNKVTDKKGTASINLNLKSGTYNVLTTFDETSKYLKQTTKSTVTIKSTIKCSDFTKYYKNNAAYYATFYDQKGRLLKNIDVKFKLNSKTYSIKTNSKGVGKLYVNLKPGKYNISSINPKTTETIRNTVFIKSLIETKNLICNESDTAKFNVKILNSFGKASPNKKITINVDGKTYTKKTNSNGIATLYLNLKVGTYTITTEYLDLKSTNKITVNKVIKKSSLMHSSLIPDYVNVTIPYVFKNSKYSIKTGFNGIIKMPKNEVFTVQVGNKNYTFTTSKISGIESQIIDYKSYFIPFDGSGIRSDVNKNNLKGNGIIITKINGYTQIDYQSKTSGNIELFGVYADKGPSNSETITYLQNDEIMAKINIQTQSFDEYGLRYSLSKYYSKSINEFNSKSYDEVTNHNTALIKFANTKKPVTFSYFGKNIVGYISKEDIQTRFLIDGKEETEKIETISYGLGEKYRKTMGFEVLQTYTIINEKITSDTLKKWISLSNSYLTKFGKMNVYGMHLASLEVAWLADEFADKYSNEFNVVWKRDHTLTILGGINLEDTYLNILNADMGMDISGNERNVIAFRFVNSLNLPNIEDYCLSEVSKRFMDNISNSLENVFDAISKNKFSITQLGEMIYVFSEDETKSAIIINSTSGIANVIVHHDNSVYKGSSISTTKDCCGVGIMPQDIIAGIKNTMNPNSNAISQLLNYSQPLSYMAYLAGKEILKRALSGASATCLGLFSTMALVQSAGTTYRDKMVDEKDWHSVMDKYTFTRPGYLQSKKIYNIPNKKGGYDYIEVKINSDLTLDRNSAKYISNGNTKQLTKDETYQYFSEEYCTPFSLPTKYWDDSWKGIVK